MMAPSPAAAEDKNHPSYWEGIGYGTCVKVEAPGTPYTLDAAPAGSAWSMLVVKAGSESSTNDPHAEYPNPVPGSYYHPSGKAISHIIKCSRGGSSGSTTTSTTAPDGCGTYTPRQLSANKASVEPGDSVTITGVAGGNDTLTFTIGGTGIATVTLGTVQTAPNGTFSFTAIIPDAYPAGSYKITVRSTTCPRTGTLTIVTQSVDRSGCGSGNPLTLVRGTGTSWKLITGTPPFNQAKSVTLTLTQRATGGVSYALGTGAWPSTGTRVVNVPANAPLDRYYLIQSGSQQGNNKPRTESCPIRVVDPPPPATTSIVPPATQPVVAAAAGGLLLLALRRRRIQGGLDAHRGSTSRRR
ncbi:hypothetical protein ACE2AJ_18185 [Aquihabitans daechungensis]|uniref:hypothetical protein n=1 Tax=Aquihabitans daechungensis TaxID=1052257 RepID=UPI003BA0D873